MLEDIRPDEKIATILRVTTFEEEACILMATRKGWSKRRSSANSATRAAKGFGRLDIDEGDEVIAARLVKPGQQVMLFTYKGMAVRFDEKNVRSMGRMARGVKGVNSAR